MLTIPRMFSRDIRPWVRLFDEPFLEPSSASLFHSPHLQHLNSFTPSFDVKETKDSYVLDGELPGITDKSLLDLSFVDDNTLIIKGRIERNSESGNKDDSEGAESDASAKAKYQAPSAEEEGTQSSTKQAEGTEGSQTVAKSTPTEVEKQQPQDQNRYWVRERYVGQFQRSFSFPQNIDHEAVKASLKDGILSVVIPKKTKSEAVRKITVE